MFGIHKHKWDKWSDIYITEGGNEAQERRCLICNIIDRKLLDYNKKKINYK